MKENVEKRAYCRTDEARTFIRKRIAGRKHSAKKEITMRQDALDSVLHDESLQVLPDDKLVLEIFFSEEIPDIRIAKEVCLQCPVMEDCLLDAVKSDIGYGVWGGQFFKNGVIDQPKRRGRPPKVVRPEFEVLNVPIAVKIQDYLEEQQRDPQAA